VCSHGTTNDRVSISFCAKVIWRSISPPQATTNRMYALGSTTMRLCASVSSNVAQQSSSGSSVCRVPVQQQRQQQQRPRVSASKHEAASSPNPAAAAVAAAAAIVLQSCIAVSQAAQAAAAVESMQQQLQQQWQRPVLGELSFAATAPALEEDGDQEESLQEIEDDIMAQVAIPEELTNFMDMLQKVCGGDLVLGTYLLPLTLCLLPVLPPCYQTLSTYLFAATQLQLMYMYAAACSCCCANRVLPSLLPSCQPPARLSGLTALSTAV
jgi:hypothetical protein